jgi:hypothetical protein
MIAWFEGQRIPHVDGLHGYLLFYRTQFLPALAACTVQVWTGTLVALTVLQAMVVLLFALVGLCVTLVPGCMLTMLEDGVQVVLV